MTTSTATGVPVAPAPSRGRMLAGALFGTRVAPLPADCALIAARIALAWIFVYHGSRRLFGWFDGPGIHDSAQYFANVAHLHPGTFFAVTGGIIEFFGGIAIAVGLLTRLAGAAIFVDMMMAIITVTWANGINATGTKSGYELNIGLGVLALMVAVFGAGRVSIDALIARRIAGPAPPAPTAELGRARRSRRRRSYGTSMARGTAVSLSLHSASAKARSISSSG